MADDAKNPKLRDEDISDESVVNDEPVESSEKTANPERGETKEKKTSEVDDEKTEEGVENDKAGDTDVNKNDNDSDDADEDSNTEEEGDEDEDNKTDDTEDDSADSENDRIEKIEIEIETNQKNDKSHNDFQEEVREQIENCKFEIIAAIQESVHTELESAANKRVRQIDHRRKIGVVVRDIIILLLAAMVGFLAYCLYDVRYFSFMKSDCEREGNCVSSNMTEPEPVQEVKDLAWYKRNYGYLFDSLQTKQDADKVSAYYLYSGDYKVSEIQPEYLLAMAFNRLNSTPNYDVEKGMSIPAENMKTAFVDLFGSAEGFKKQDFTRDCMEFKYDKASDEFLVPNEPCTGQTSREILEEITEIHEEGNVLYFLSSAGIFDKKEGAFYSFDNLFRPAVTNVNKDDFTKHMNALNKYQYQFKKVDDKYYFSSVVKLK